MSGGQGVGDAVEQGAHLTVDDDRVETFLAAEMLVHHGLGNLRAGRDLLDGGRVEPALGKELPPDRDELLASLGR